MEKPSEMVKRVGERLRNECLDVFGATWSYDVAWRFANAAIEEMRTPTKAMLEAVEAEEERRGYVGYESMDAEQAWPVMISAALKENEEKA